MAIVADVSAILSLVLDDEDATYAEAVIEAIAADEGVVPTLFWFELRNALLMGERRQRLTSQTVSDFLSNLALLPFIVDDVPREAALLELARTHRLTVYDAGYLELAARKRLPLATRHAALARAAVASGVELFSPG